MDDHVDKFRDFQEQFNNLRIYDKQVRETIAELKDRSQTGTLQEYLEPFTSLLNDGWLEEELAVSLFLGGLSVDILNRVTVFKPLTLDVAYALVRLQELFPLPETHSQLPPAMDPHEPQMESAPPDSSCEEYGDDVGCNSDIEDHKEEQPLMVTSGTHFNFPPMSEEGQELVLLDLKGFGGKNEVGMSSIDVFDSKIVDESLEGTSPVADVSEVCWKLERSRIRNSCMANGKLRSLKAIADLNYKPIPVVNSKGEGKQLEAEEMSSMILTKVSNIAEAYLVTKDVDVTVPTCSCSNEFQRKATKDVEFNFGLNVTHIINRPIDAAIGYSFDKKINSFSEQNMLIFDLGGRILVVFFLTIGEGIFEMKTTAGNTFLSGVWVLLKLRCSLGRYRGFRFKVGHIQNEENLMSELSMWHCPACRDGPSAIDWYQGLQPLISQVTTMGANRIKLHEEFEKIVEEELRQLETSIVLPSELFSRWKGLSAQGKDHDIIWSPMGIIMYTRLEQDENEKWSMGKAEILNCFNSDKPLKGQGTFDCGHVGDNEGICESWVLAKVILLPNTICIIAARHVVAITMDVGRTYKSEELQKQMFVVILSGWSMICFGHKLIKPWEVNLQENFPHNDHLTCWDKPKSMMEKWPLTMVNTSAPGAEVAVKTAALLASTSLVLKTDSLEDAADLFGKEGRLGSSMACRVNDLNACLFCAGNGYWMVQEELPTSGGNFYKFSLCLASHVPFMKSCPFLFHFSAIVLVIGVVWACGKFGNTCYRFLRQTLGTRFLKGGEMLRLSLAGGRIVNKVNRGMGLVCMDKEDEGLECKNVLSSDQYK